MVKSVKFPLKVMLLHYW